MSFDIDRSIALIRKFEDNDNSLNLTNLQTEIEQEIDNLLVASSNKTSSYYRDALEKIIDDYRSYSSEFQESFANPFEEIESGRFQEFRVFHDFADEASGFSLSKGDVVSVDIDQSESDPLRWYGCKLGVYEVGWFPRHCVEEGDQRLLNPFSSEYELNDSDLALGQLPRSNNKPSAAKQFAISVNILSKTSWAEIVGIDYVKSLSKERVKRQEAMFELAATESRYVGSLQILLQIFYCELASIMPEKDLQVIFANIDEILICNTELLSDLEARYETQMPEIQSIGDVLINHFTKLHIYITYCGNQSIASKFLQEKRKSTEISDILKRCQMDPRCRQLDIGSFLLEPMQRLTRYPLLIKQILHYTDKAIPDHENLLVALNAAESILKRVNEAAREKESISRLSDLQRQICFEPVHIELVGSTKLLGRRLILKEGVLYKAKSNRKLVVILTNDLLLLLDKANSNDFVYSIYRNRPIPVEELLIKEIENPKQFSNFDEKWFQIIHIDTIITVKAENMQDKRSWMNSIEEAIRNYRVYEKKMLKVRASSTEKEKECIGTVEAFVHYGKDLLPVKSGNLCPFCILQIGDQKMKTKVATESKNPSWNQGMVFSLSNLDDILRITVYHYDRFSSNAYLGQAELALDFLEYYGQKETELIEMKLKDVPSGSVFIHLHFCAA